MERSYWLGFSMFPGVGPRKFNLLLENFGTAKKAWQAEPVELEKILGGKLCAKFKKFRSEFSIASYERKLQKKKVVFLTLQDSGYPKLLLEIKNPPFVLFVKSEFGLNVSNHLNKNAIAIVGTRRITSYGREVTELLTSELVNSGFTIVSGLAMGVDAVAHKSALESNGITIAVLGCGVDCCSPEENLNLYDEIIEKGGAIISELPLGHPPTKGSFPARNRIIAGLSQAVLVTEGAADSGALITADYARQYGHKVFAVPGPITSSLSKGPYALLQKGAKLVTEAADIIKELGSANYELGKRSAGNKRKVIKGETKEEQRILDLLENEAMHFDEIVRKVKLDSARVGQVLTMMEIRGIVKSEDSGYFGLVK